MYVFVCSSTSNFGKAAVVFRIAVTSVLMQNHNYKNPYDSRGKFTSYQETDDHFGQLYLRTFHL
jgi:hypothetical protein